MRQALQDRARDLPVKFTGYIPDSECVRLRNASDLVVIPSRNEPFDLALLEAWSAERCVVASDEGTFPRISMPFFVNGINVPAEPEALA